jgi:hypothetical protein
VGAYLALLGPVAAAVRETVKQWAGHHRTGPSVVTRSTAVATAAMGVLLGLFVLQVLLGFTNGLNYGRSWFHTQSDVADITANIDAAPDQLVQTFNPYIYSTEQVRRLAAFARADQLSLFATSLGATDRRSGLFAELVTRMVRPVDGSVLSGRALLDATTDTATNVTTVQFRANRPGRASALVGTGQSTRYGWLAGWDTTSVTDGTYQLRSQVSFVDGKKVESQPITVVIHNAASTPPTR